MPETPPNNAKIYARPEKKAPSPLYIALAFLVLMAAGFFAYRMYFRAAPTPAPSAPGHSSRVLPSELSHYAIASPDLWPSRSNLPLCGQRRDCRRAALYV